MDRCTYRQSCEIDRSPNFLRYGALLMLIQCTQELSFNYVALMCSQCNRLLLFTGKSVEMCDSTEVTLQIIGLGPSLKANINLRH